MTRRRRARFHSAGRALRRRPAYFRQWRFAPGSSRDSVFERTATRFLRRIHRVTHGTPVKLRAVEKQRVLVVAPHPDDEVIAVGGTLALHQRAGSEVLTLFVTLDAPAADGSIVRKGEAERAGRLLGFEPRFLGFPDGSVSLHEPDVASAIPLTDAIVELVRAGLGVGLVSRWAVAPHEASGQIVTRRFTKAGMKERWSAVYNRRDAGPRLILARFAEMLGATPPTLSARARLA